MRSKPRMEDSQQLEDSNPSKNGDDLASYPKIPKIRELGLREGRTRDNDEGLSENVREGGRFCGEEGV